MDSNKMDSIVNMDKKCIFITILTKFGDAILWMCECEWWACECEQVSPNEYF